MYIIHGYQVTQIMKKMKNMTINKIYKTLITIILLSIIMQISMADEGIGNNNPVTYRSYVDGYRGFSRVTDDNGE